MVQVSAASSVGCGGGFGIRVVVIVAVVRGLVLIGAVVNGALVRSGQFAL